MCVCVRERERAALCTLCERLFGARAWPKDAKAVGVDPRDERVELGVRWRRRQLRAGWLLLLLLLLLLLRLLRLLLRLLLPRAPGALLH